RRTARRSDCPFNLVLCFVIDGTNESAVGGQARTAAIANAIVRMSNNGRDAKTSFHISLIAKQTTKNRSEVA
ncbi:MAG: hypothetical protein MK097_06810, partial [Dechloromonas sp.]|nr:hypothetical protein [Dechloromonas sp.]